MTTDKKYTVFVHLLDSNGGVLAQVDAEPRGGTYPTSLWDAGEIVKDEYSIPLLDNMKPGNYPVEIGLYDSTTMQRLPVVDSQGHRAGDHLDLMEITIP